MTQTRDPITDNRPEDHYGELFNRIPLPLYRTSVEGDWLAGNQAFLDLVEADSLSDLPHARELWADPDLRMERIGDLEAAEADYSEKPILIRTLRNNLIWTKPQTVIVREEGKVVYFEGAMIDITAQKQEEQARSELTNILEETSDTVIAVLPNGTLCYVNKAARELFNLPDNGTEDPRSIVTLLPATFLDQLHRFGAFMTEIEVATTSGPIALELTTQEHRTSTGQLDYYSAIGRDVTANKLVSEHLEDAVRSKDRFIASVSHELRTPLTSVLGFALVLRDLSATADPTERAELTEAVIEHSLELSNLVEDLLVNASFDGGSVRIIPQSIDLMDELQRSLVSAANPTTKSLLMSGTARAWADPLRVRQIARNLLSNASRYGGPDVRVDVHETDVHAVLEVSDNGPALREESWDHIFEPYESEHDNQSLSVGLGLTVSRRLARLMGGDLVYSHKDGRSIFRLTLPRINTSETDSPKN